MAASANWSRVNDTDMDGILNWLNSQRSSRAIPAEHAVVMSLCVAAVISNTAALLAIRGIRRALVPNQMLIASLCCADLLTSASIFCYLLGSRYFNDYYDSTDADGAARQCVKKAVQGMTMSSHHATLLSLLGLSVDHYCAVALPLQQPVLLSLSRVRATIVAIWVSALAFGFSDFFVPAPLNAFCQGESFTNYCERVACSTYEPDHLLFVVVAACLAVMSVLYARIASKICSYQRQWRLTSTSTVAMTEESTKKTGPTCRGTRGLATTVIILATFAVLWLPYCVFDVIITLKLYYAGPEWELDAAYYFSLFKRGTTYLYGLIALNAIVDPIIYAIRMREVQQSLRLLCGTTPCAKLCWRYRPCSSRRERGEAESRHGVVKVRISQPSASNGSSSRMTAV